MNYTTNRKYNLNREPRALEGRKKTRGGHMPNQDCPLCNNASDFIGRDNNNFKAFGCNTCTEFIISITAEKRLLEAPHEWRDQLSDQAQKTPKGHVLWIEIPPKFQGDVHGSNDEVLRGVYRKQEN